MRIFSVQIAIPFIGLTGIGWLLVVIGFGIVTVRDNADEGDPQVYPQWMVSFCGPLIIAAAIAHAATWMPTTAIVGAIVSCKPFHFYIITRNINIELQSIWLQLNLQVYQDP